jgi:hypothetical protein
MLHHLLKNTASISRRPSKCSNGRSNRAILTAIPLQKRHSASIGHLFDIFAQRYSGIYLADLYLLISRHTPLRSIFFIFLFLSRISHIFDRLKEEAIYAHIFSRPLSAASFQPLNGDS